MIKHYYITLLVFLLSCNSNTDTNSKNSTNIEQEPLHHFESNVQMMKVTGQKYTPLYGNDSTDVEVGDFWMDQYPVTNEEFKKFVILNPKWRKSNMKQVFADKNYLMEWDSDTTYSKNMLPDAPVTNISWFAANAYAKSVGKRLPTVDEWEFVALSDNKNIDARTKDTYNQEILSWYEKPKTYDNKIGTNRPNYWGIYDLHGLVWEWNLDFNSIMMTGESRKDGSNDNKLFCGSASLGAADKMNYAAFIRYAFRGSLKANYCVKNLGFRCVKN